MPDPVVYYAGSGGDLMRFWIIVVGIYGLLFTAMVLVDLNYLLSRKPGDDPAAKMARALVYGPVIFGSLIHLLTVITAP